MHHRDVSKEERYEIWPIAREVLERINRSPQEDGQHGPVLVVRCPQAEVGAVEAPPGEEVPFIAEEPQVPVQVGPCGKGGQQSGDMRE